MQLQSQDLCDLKRTSCHFCLLQESRGSTNFNMPTPHMFSRLNTCTSDPHPIVTFDGKHYPELLTSEVSSKVYVIPNKYFLIPHSNSKGSLLNDAIQLYHHRQQCIIKTITISMIAIAETWLEGAEPRDFVSGSLGLYHAPLAPLMYLYCSLFLVLEVKIPTPRYSFVCGSASSRSAFLRVPLRRHTL